MYFQMHIQLTSGKSEYFLYCLIFSYKRYWNTQLCNSVRVVESYWYCFFLHSLNSVRKMYSTLMEESDSFKGFNVRYVFDLVHILVHFVV